MKLFFSGAISDLQEGIKIMQKRLGYTIDKGGIPVKVLKGENGIKVFGDEKGATIEYERKIEFFRGLGLLIEALSDGGEFNISEKANFKTDGMMVDCSRNSVMTVESIKKLLEMMAAMGLNMLMLYTEDTFEVEGYPYFGYMRGRYTYDELKECDDYAYELGIEMVPCIQTLAHLFSALKWDSCGIPKDTEDVLMIGDDKTYEFIDDIIKAASKPYRSKKIHIGMDEAWNLGLGQYLKKYGFHEKQELLLYHLERVIEIAKKYNYACEMWADMFFRMVQGSDFVNSGVVPKGIKELIPEGVNLIHWMYEKQPEGVFERQLCDVKSLSDNVSFAGSARKEFGLAPYNRYSIELMEEQMQVCREQDIDRYIVTLWSNSGAFTSIFSVLPAVYAACELAKGKTAAEIDKAKFKEIVGLDYDSFMLLDHMNDPFYKYMDTVNNRSFWGLFMDMLIPSYDSLIPEGINEAYAELAERYAAIDAGKFQPIFNNYINLSKILSIKMELSLKIRKAYKENDVEHLSQYAKSDIAQMVSLLEHYLKQYEEYWFGENMAYGIEVHHLYIGGLIARWKSVEDRLLNYVANGVKIEELENEALPNRLTPWCYKETSSIDDCMEPNFKRVISFCWL